MHSFRKAFVINCLLLFFVLSAFAQSDVGIKLGFQLKNGKKAVIPFELHNNLIVIPVILNDALPLKFILDTGVRTAILTDRTISDLLNLTYSRTMTIYGIGGEKIVDAQIANDVTLEIPGVRGRGHALFVLEQDLLQLRNYLGTEIHGILGYELLSRFIVKINFERKKIYIYDPSVFKPPKRYHKVPMEVIDTKPHILAPLSINGKDTINARLMIDTGASHTLMLLSTDSVQFDVPEKNVESSLGRGLGGPIEGKVARISGLKIDDYPIKNPVSTFPDPESYPDSVQFFYRTGSIGGALISRFNVIFDYHKSLLYIKKNSDFRKPYNYNLSGLVLKAEGLRLTQFIIDQVLPDSPADHADLEPGDIIITINGKPTTDMNLDNVIGFFNSRENRLINLTVLRGKKKIATSFRLHHTL